MTERSVVIKKSKQMQNDEFYTLLQDIEKEVPLYGEQFCGKRVLCPCDWSTSFRTGKSFEDAFAYRSRNDSIVEIDIEESEKRLRCDTGNRGENFLRFFVSHAKSLGVASLRASGYDPVTRSGVRFQDIDYSGYDIVVTNPPLSLFLEFVNTMISSGKKFLAIGPQNALTYKNVFAHVMENRLWLGHHHHLTGLVSGDGIVLSRNDPLPRCCCWYTNLDVAYRSDRIPLTKSYFENKDKYPHYYDFDGIDVGRTSDIPYDYDGLMGVPVTFLQRYNPHQFEIVGNSGSIKKNKSARDFAKQFCTLGGHNFVIRTEDGFRVPYHRIVVRNREVRNRAEKELSA